MTAKPFLSLLITLCIGVTFSQQSAAQERAALKHVEKNQWKKAEVVLRRTLEKHPLDPALRYVFSRFYFQNANPAFNIDSAYHYAVTALDGYASDPAKGRDRLQRVKTDSIGLVQLRARIDSAAFAIARLENTEAAYEEFLSHFPSAVQRELAQQLRDEVAYQEALRMNTHQAFHDYIKRYPSADRAAEARSRYERLLYLDHTRDGRLTSYQKFLSDHPDTPFRNEILGHIFELSTASATVQSFLSFAQRYPETRLATRARQMVFHLLTEQDDPQWPAGLLNDSLKHILRVNGTYLVPVMKNDRYGFIDADGEAVLPAAYTEIPDEYLCGNITDELLRLDGKLYSRSGSLVYTGDIRRTENLGAGFLKVDTRAGYALLHKGGFVVMDSLEDVRIIAGKYVAARRNNAWRLHTLTGRLLDDHQWGDILTLAGLVLFKGEGGVFLLSVEHIAQSAELGVLRFSDPLDDVKLWNNDLIWARSGRYEGVLTRNLKRFIGFDQHTLTLTSFGATAALPNGYALYNTAGRRSPTFEEVRQVGAWVAVKSKGGWFVIDPSSHALVSTAYDSVSARGPYLVGSVSDTLYVHFNMQRVSCLPQARALGFIPADSSSFLVVEQASKQKTLYDLQGNALFSGSFDALEYAGHGVFVATAGGKKGLIDLQGKMLLPAEYDAIGTAKDNVLSLLKRKRFGAYHVLQKKLVRPQYDRNLIPYAKDWLATFKNGAYGFVGWDNKPVSAFRFDEIVFWQDSVALVKEGGFWGLYDIAKQRLTEGGLRRIMMVRDQPEEKIAIAQRNNQYGVISNRRGVVIPLTFSEVINVGSPYEPLYFTEKHIPEASLFVVIYYDREGKMLRKEIYDDAAQYDRIYCSDH